MPGWGGDTESDKIAAWVKAHYSATTVDGRTLYDLTAHARS